MRSTSIVVAAMLGLSLVHPAAQSPASRTLTGTLTVRSGNNATAILGKRSDAKPEDFMFCVDRDPASPQKIEFSGPGRVVYQPLPKPPMPDGVEIKGPEMVASTLAVVSDDGRAWVFVGKGQKPVLAAGDPALAKATIVTVRNVQRTDWAAEAGPRRGVDIEGCIAAGG